LKWGDNLKSETFVNPANVVIYALEKVFN